MFHSAVKNQQLWLISIPLQLYYDFIQNSDDNRTLCSFKIELFNFWKNAKNNLTKNLKKTIIRVTIFVRFNLFSIFYHPLLQKTVKIRRKIEKKEKNWKNKFFWKKSGRVQSGRVVFRLQLCRAGCATVIQIILQQEGLL